MRNLPLPQLRQFCNRIVLFLLCFISLTGCRKSPVASPHSSPIPTPVPYEDIIVYTSQGELYTTNLAGDETGKLSGSGKHIWFPVVAPDNQKISYWSNASGFYELWILDIPHRHSQQITFFNEKNTSTDFQNFNVHNAPSWTPDSKRIIFSRMGLVWSIDANGFNLETLIASGENYSPAVSPDGKWLIYVSDINQIRNLYLYAFNTGEAWPLTKFPSSHRVGSPAWSGDNQQIAFTVSVFEKVDIWLVRQDGSELKKITNDGYSNSPAWSPDGTRLAFTSGRQDPYNWEIWGMNRDGSGQFSITTNGGFSPSWYRRSFLSQEPPLASDRYQPAATATPIIKIVPLALPVAIKPTATMPPMAIPKSKPVKPIPTATAKPTPKAISTIVKSSAQPTLTKPVFALKTAIPTPTSQTTKPKNSQPVDDFNEEVLLDAPAPAVFKPTPTKSASPVVTASAGEKDEYEKYEQYADKDTNVLPQTETVPEKKGNQILFAPKIDFYFAKDLIKPNSLEALRKVAEEISQYPDAPLVVRGYMRGPLLLKKILPLLKTLSRARANSVLRHLIVNEKIRQINVTAIGDGEPLPDSNDSTEKALLLIEIK